MCIGHHRVEWKSKEGSQVQLVSCTLSTNAARKTGGAVFAGYGSNVTLKACQLSSNKAKTQGGAVRIDGHSNAELESCSLRSNTAYSGGAASASYHSILTLRNCDISGNHASISGGGGGGRVDASSEIRVVTSCIRNNRATGSTGAGALACAGKCFLERSVVGTNSEPWISVAKATIVLNMAVLVDGAGCNETVHSLTHGRQPARGSVGLQLLDRSFAIALQSNVACRIDTQDSGFIYSDSMVGDYTQYGVAEALSAAVCKTDSLCEKNDVTVPMPSEVRSQAVLACPNDPVGTRREFSPSRRASPFCLPNVCDQGSLERCGSNATLSSSRWYCPNDRETNFARRFIVGEDRFCMQHIASEASENLDTKVIQGVCFGVAVVLCIGYCAYMVLSIPGHINRDIRRRPGALS